ncbi:polyisoprenoid-binding protein YceI [Sphingomonas jinjuensis]|uniref:Polyisoprenoid-binding protein YceI n=1 Tax=Sphingomonas jinjuensis TaxID=535907 RepID=A0A840FAW0_9SPHN|nr:YceI family protein [Sphingomonas jinjuensis]MBB4153406.1 polyisoprenoid-binding protein YceI [Sphingomonas jinjuensis]
MRSIMTAAALALAAASATTVAQTAPGTRNVAAVAGGTYTADPAHTQVTWTVDHMGFTPLSGMFGDISGTLMLDPKNPGGAKVDLTIPVSKLVNPAAGLTQHMFRAGKDGGKPDFFGPNPADAKFVSTAVRASGESATITGNLTLNGVTKPVTLQAKFYGAGKAPAMMGGKENVGFTATGTLKRSDFGLGLAAPIVSDEVKLTINAAFQK